MTKKYHVSVKDSKEFSITEKEVNDSDITTLESSKFHIIKNNKSYHSEVLSSDFDKKSYEVKVNNNTYNINIFNDLDVLIKKMGFEVGSTKVVNDIKAPMPGLILDILIKNGQEVKENDALLILEAMKMENVLTSPRDGVINSISVEKGDAVEKNQLLITFE